MKLVVCKVRGKVLQLADIIKDRNLAFGQVDWTVLL